MTSRERLLAAMRCEMPDRAPIQVRGVPVWNEAWVRSRDASYRPLVDAVREHGDWVAGWGPQTGRFLSDAPLDVSRAATELDDRWTLHETTLQTPKGPLTATYQSSRVGMPGLERSFFVKTEEDVERFLSLPYVAPAPPVEDYFRLDETLGERGLVIASLLNPAGYVHDLIGSELLSLWSVERRDVIRRLVGLFTERLRHVIEVLLSSGVRGVYGFLGEEYVTPPLQSPRDFHEFVTDPERELFDLIHAQGGLIHVHCHGPMDAVLEEFAVMGANCLHPIEAPPLGDMPLADAKRRIGGSVCLEGNVQIGDLYAMEPEAFRRSVEETVAVGAVGGGFILCPSASPHTPTLSPVTVRNYLTMIETGVRLGRAV